MSDEPAILINLLKVKPRKQDALIALLKQNTDTVIRTLPRLENDPADRGKGRRRRRHLPNGRAAQPSRRCAADPRMKVYSKIAELASLDSITGSTVSVSVNTQVSLRHK